MPRQPRLDAPGLLHHVIARGIERRSLFLTATDYQDFLARIGIVGQATFSRTGSNRSS
ncbi:MAG: hypothetical protein HYZ73_00560 [Elusimicrobia bacterium]|nr:hypothetical protein [Elusimicrobiota bacterium]